MQRLHEAIIRGSRFTVHGSRFTVHGSRFRVHGSGFTVQGSRFTVHGSWFRVHGYGSWFVNRRMSSGVISSSVSTTRSASPVSFSRG
ncbi:MAG: hypothetical protein DMF84_09495 [Acidobacteria bacterium]|nr:MAG: hypothetical protein DMF84_09495 [Acidobacteriota bacterium]